MSQRVELVGGPHDGEQIVLHEGNSLRIAIPPQADGFEPTPWADPMEQALEIFEHRKTQPRRYYVYALRDGSPGKLHYVGIKWDGEK